MSYSRDNYRISNQLVLRELRNAYREVFFLAVEPLEEKLMLVIPITSKMGPLQLKYFPTCQGTKVQKVLFDKIGPLNNKQSVTVIQTSSANDLFESFVTNLLESLWEVEAECVYVEAQKCMQQWQQFFSKINNGGLSLEAQRGLYGELYLLRYFLKKECHPDIVMNWQGPFRKHIDFLFDGIGLEVKTTFSVKPIKVTISSEYQLEAKELELLYLVVLQLEEAEKSGETLFEIILEIRELLSEWPTYSKQYETALLAVGYHDVQHELYSIDRYNVNEILYFRINEQFPKITTEMIPNHVVNVRYDILLEGLSEFQTDESIFINTIQGMQS
ncbi:PD-(D/E)XK motif protein [Paenibacillus luteus]|uniref:PD-(D/E)XK motif protein n=1 Tax=Paenibacillus luteus TaxID=2545753 RepID=UPI00240D6B0B|nr:PD-(D/E)XK motif protein [Paenibacillus luteus]